jgi:DNA primase
LTQKLKLIFDPDAAGIRATLRSADLIAPSGLSAEVVTLPEGQDPDSFIRTRSAESFSALLNNSTKLLDFAIEECLTDPQASTIDGKLRISQALLPAIQKVRHPIERGYYLKKLAEGLQVPEQDLLEAAKVQRKVPAERKEGLGSSPDLSEPPRLPKEDEILIHLILHQQLSMPRFLKELEPEDFSDSKSCSLIRALAGSYYKSGAVQLQDLIHEEALEPQLAGLLTALSVKEPDYEDPDRTIVDCLRIVKVKKLQVQMKELEKQIRFAEKEGRSDSVRTLQGQLLGLKKRSLGPDSNPALARGKEVI